jgi:hypothetical protein
VGRKILALVAGLVVGFSVIVVVQAAGQALWPLPTGLDPRDRVAIVAALHAMPPAFLLWTALSWMCGALAGTYLASRVVRDSSVAWPAFAVEAALLTMGVLNVAVLEYPPWFWLLGLSAFPLGAFAGMRWARGTGAVD